MLRVWSFRQSFQISILPGDKAVKTGGDVELKLFHVLAFPSVDIILIRKILLSSFESMDHTQQYSLYIQVIEM